MIDNETLLGYALNALDPADQEAVRQKLLDDTAASVNLARLQAILKPLEADRTAPAPALDLTQATLARLEASLTQPKPRVVAAGRWVELALAASIGLLGFGLVATGVSKFQADNERVACANTLRTLSAGLHSYADTYDNRLPQVGLEDAPTAGDFHTILQKGGHLPAGAVVSCQPKIPIGYTYLLGHRNSAGQLIGPMRHPDSCSQMPISSDFPSKACKIEGLVSPHGKGQNVLFVDGHVNFLNHPDMNGDHIFLNDKGLPKAGLHPKDHVLGHPADVP